MDRLTMTSDKGGAAFTFDLDITCEKTEIKKILKLAERLKEYEDLEEQGKLLKLPCAVGDTVYAFRFREMFTLRVDSFEVFSDVIYLRLINDTPGYRFMRMTLDIASFGKEWFLNREAAEAALKEMSE